MQSHFHVVGPFKISVEAEGAGKRIESTNGADFWKQEDVSSISRKRGCYIFAIRAGKGFTPWYVGKASKCFKQEVFQAHKLTKYNRALDKAYFHGTPVLFFVTPPGSNRKIDKKTLDRMEMELIWYAKAKNPDLCNKNHTSNQWTIQGVIRPGQGKPTDAAQDFKTMMRIK